jgi:hypothetical protein
MDFLAELQKIEKQSNEAKINKAKLEQKLTTLQEEQKKLLEELKTQGVTEETLASTIESLGIDIENSIEEAQEMLK